MCVMSAGRTPYPDYDGDFNYLPVHFSSLIYSSDSFCFWQLIDFEHSGKNPSNRMLSLKGFYICCPVAATPQLAPFSRRLVSKFAVVSSSILNGLQKTRHFISSFNVLNLTFVVIKTSLWFPGDYVFVYRLNK